MFLDEPVKFEYLAHLCVLYNYIFLMLDNYFKFIRTCSPMNPEPQSTFDVVTLDRNPRDDNTEIRRGW